MYQIPLFKLHNTNITWIYSTYSRSIFHAFLLSGLLYAIAFFLNLRTYTCIQFLWKCHFTGIFMVFYLYCFCMWFLVICVHYLTTSLVYKLLGYNPWYLCIINLYSCYNSSAKIQTHQEQFLNHRILRPFLKVYIQQIRIVSQEFLCLKCSPSDPTA